jgi:DNA polymerase III delta subunit
VEPDALDLLVESVGTQLIDLINEVEKICLAAVGETTVDRELVSAVVGKYRTENLFSLLKALEQKDPASMIRKLDRLIDGGEQPVVMLGMLLKRVVLLMEVKAIVDAGGRGREVSSGRALAGLMSGAVNPFYAEVLLGQARRFERAELERLLANLRWADFKLKTSQLMPKHLIEEAFLASHLGKTLAYADNNL